MGPRTFANPTNVQGATLGYDTYLGGYSEFRPLTSSTDAAVFDNQATAVAGVAEDISGRGRDLGGIPDLGAYELICRRVVRYIMYGIPVKYRWLWSVWEKPFCHST